MTDHPLTRLADLPANLWRVHRRKARERAAVAALNGLGDELLRDIGICRGDIRSVAQNGRLCR